MPPEPLSVQLRRLVDDPAVRTLNGLIARTEGRGLYLAVLLLALPMTPPATVPVLSNVLAVALLVLSLRLAFRLPARLPRFLGERELAGETMGRVLRASARFVGWLERFLRPRRSEWMLLPPVVTAHALLMAWLAFLIALPIPPVIPFTNMLPAQALVLVAASMMERDGRLIWAGYAMALVSTLYFALFFGTITHVINEHGHLALAWLRERL